MEIINSTAMNTYYFKFKAAAVLFGPSLSLLFLLSIKGSTWLAPAYFHVSLVAMLLIWSPLFFSIPALILQEGRDNLLTNLSKFPLNIVRGIVLIPASILSKNSSIKLLSAFALAGWIFGIVLATHL